MLIVLLTFADNRARAGELMDGHNAWLNRGFDDGVFMLAGSLQPGRGGAIVAANTTREALERRVDEDPFVVENVVTAEILEISPARAETRLEFLLDDNAG